MDGDIRAYSGVCGHIRAYRAYRAYLGISGICGHIGHIRAYRAYRAYADICGRTQGSPLRGDVLCPNLFAVGIINGNVHYPLFSGALECQHGKIVFQIDRTFD